MDMKIVFEKCRDWNLKKKGEVNFCNQSIFVKPKEKKTVYIQR